MVFGLQEAGALARIAYHAQELSLLAVQASIDPEEVQEVKKALDDAFDDLFHPMKEHHGRSN